MRFPTPLMKKTPCPHRKFSFSFPKAATKTSRRRKINPLPSLIFRRIHALCPVKRVLLRGSAVKKLPQAVLTKNRKHPKQAPAPQKEAPEHPVPLAATICAQCLTDVRFPTLPDATANRLQTVTLSKRPLRYPPIKRKRLRHLFSLRTTKAPFQKITQRND